MLDAVTGWDWFVAAVVLLSVGFGVLRGLVRTIFALAAWGVAVLGVPLGGPPLARALPDAVPELVSYGVVFLLLFVSVRMLGSLAAKALRGIGLGGADRLLGAAFGAARAVLVILVAALGAHFAGLSKQPAWTQALTRPLLDGLVREAEPYLPEKVSGIRRT
ncbi:MAG: CvpA family protein [Burkholderiaceae bacterium]|jgi:membrane protein required for colicin V production